MTYAVDSHLRVIIVNFNGGRLLERAVDSVFAATWPGSVDVVVVDNASTDHSLSSLRSNAQVHIIETGTNGGFSAANRGFGPISGLANADFYFLLNPDAQLDQAALAPLADALTGRVGVAAPLIVFDQDFVDLDVDAKSIVEQVLVDGENVTSRCLSPTGIRLPGQGEAMWLFDEAAALSVPVSDASASIDLTVSSSRGRDRRSVQVGSLGRSTRVQNAGGRLDTRWFGINEHFGRELDEILDIESVPSRLTDQWCGAAALLSAEYVEDTGGFDDRFFLYYEDTDLSLAGSSRGWEYVFVPSSIVRHRHSASTGQGTELVEVLQHRNRLLMMARHAPLKATANACLRAIATPGSMLMRSFRVDEVARRPLRRLAAWRLKALLVAVPRLPSAFQSRRNLRTRQGGHTR